MRQKLEELGTPGDWSHITTQIGMFSYTGLTQEMCVFLKQEKHLYLLKSGRISMCGVSERHHAIAYTIDIKQSILSAYQ